ncbi:hypothetical protein SAMN05660772_02871 [Pasteurella testudinis DSM 23072]|uniref:Uncharacterized protein n=1 Tax=Pasteurella testudinis DSM 23072 TaxID=1122938 RepID=A0A1W1V8L3_9PAST|nr:hypothetical protein [Pasteurella testudinis]SMB89371.1 hypothetical protein SAMN05660772_02871 [Pasteurella testudinis DSM 23072]SUB51647.1 Uncharacterised protein [Pasteurella testudinis]
MYYLDKSVLLQKDLRFMSFKYHAISQIRVDYINKEIEVQIASFSELDLLKMLLAENIVAIMFNYETYDFNKDINYNCLKLISEMTDSVFYGAEINTIEMEDDNEKADKLVEEVVE